MSYSSQSESQENTILHHYILGTYISCTNFTENNAAMDWDCAFGALLLERMVLHGLQFQQSGAQMENQHLVVEMAKNSTSDELLLYFIQ